jgi:hypothetical protein
VAQLVPESRLEKVLIRMESQILNFPIFPLPSPPPPSETMAVLFNIPPRAALCAAPLDVQSQSLSIDAVTLRMIGYVQLSLLLS